MKDKTLTHACASSNLASPTNQNFTVNSLYQRVQAILLLLTNNIGLMCKNSLINKNKEKIIDFTKQLFYNNI